MHKNKFKLLALVFISGLGLLILLMLNIKDYWDKSEIAFFDVGQGDSSLIKLHYNKLILIDGGPDNLVLNRIGRYLPYYQRKIDYVILSHYHDDHIMGLIEILSRYQVGSLIYMEGPKKSYLLEKLISIAKANGTKIVALNNKIELEYSENCNIKVISPLIFNISADDNNSLFVYLNCDGLRAVFNGDSNIKVEKALISSGENLKTDIFKASHHGSKTSNSEEFLSFLKPIYFIISVGIDNRFGHPNSEIIERVEALKIKIIRTDQSGDIILSK